MTPNTLRGDLAIPSLRLPLDTATETSGEPDHDDEHRDDGYDADYGGNVSYNRHQNRGPAGCILSCNDALPNDDGEDTDEADNECTDNTSYQVMSTSLYYFFFERRLVEALRVAFSTAGGDAVIPPVLA